MRKVRVLGGGFSGLTLAWRLAKLGAHVEVYERSAHVGGLLGSKRETWGLVEQAANALMNSQHVEELFQDLGLSVLYASGQSKNRYILRNGKLKRWPLGVFETARMFWGFFLYQFNKKKYGPKPEDGLEDYVVARFGAAFFHYLVSPALRGVFGTDKLSAYVLQKTLAGKSPQAPSGITGSVSAQGGMGELVSALEKRLIELGVNIHKNSLEDIDPRHLNVLCMDAHSASVLLTPHSLSAAQLLSNINYQDLSSVTLGFKNKPHEIKGFGVLFAKSEQLNSMGVLLNNYIFSERGPYWTETFIFGQAEDSESALVEKAIADHKKVFNSLNAPDVTDVYRWPKAIPVYNEKILPILYDIELPEFVYLHGNYTGQLGLQKILHRSYILANKIKDELP